MTGKSYDSLTDFVHSNFQGTLRMGGAYVNIDIVTRDRHWVAGAIVEHNELNSDAGRRIVLQNTITRAFESLNLEEL